MKEILAPIDNKNLMEDAFENEVFKGFYAAPDHGAGNHRHLIGVCKTENYEALVDVKWWFGENSIDIQVVGIQPQDFYETVYQEVVSHYKRLFKAWECPENERLKVYTSEVLHIMTVSFYFEKED